MRRLVKRINWAVFNLGFNKKMTSASFIYLCDYSDTVTIVTDMLCDVFGFDKYSAITLECTIWKHFSIQGENGR
jgi:hypothetical protein